MDSKHTPEPWYIQPYPWPPSIRTAKDGYEIAKAQSPYTNPEYRDEERANGDRIVACVNACTGMSDPAAEITRLRSLAPAWIGVEERLPDHFVEVLIYGNLPDDPGKGIVCGTYLTEDGDWYDMGILVVTHWMPLPSPPETAEGRK